MPDCATGRVATGGGDTLGLYTKQDKIFGRGGGGCYTSSPPLFSKRQTARQKIWQWAVKVPKDRGLNVEFFQLNGQPRQVFLAQQYDAHGRVGEHPRRLPYVQAQFAGEAIVVGDQFIILEITF